MGQCQHCLVPVRWITSAKKKKPVICDNLSIIRDGYEPPKAGKYMDAQGNMYDAANVPCKLPVWRVHWGDCPGSELAHAKKVAQ